MKKRYILFWLQIILSLAPILFFEISTSYNFGWLKFFMNFPIIWFLLSNLCIMFFAYKPLTEKHKRSFFDFSKHWLFLTIFCYGMYYIFIHFIIFISYLL